MRDHLLTVSQPHGLPTQDFPKNLSPPSSNTPRVLTSVHLVPARDHLLIGRTEGNKRFLVKLLSTWEKQKLWQYFWSGEHWQGNTKLDEKLLIYNVCYFIELFTNRKWCRCLNQRWATLVTITTSSFATSTFWRKTTATPTGARTRPRPWARSFRIDSRLCRTRRIAAKPGNSSAILTRAADTVVRWDFSFKLEVKTFYENLGGILGYTKVKNLFVGVVLLVNVIFLVFLVWLKYKVLALVH